MSNVYDEDEKYKPNLNGELDKNGDRLWINSEGEWHREDGPAIEWKDGGKFWYINDKLHREDGPAEEWADGDKTWWINGKRHREDGPAIERADGSKFWYINDKLHREDGPAVEWWEGDKFWHINGKNFSKDEWLQWLKSGQSSLDQKTLNRIILENS